MEKVIFLLWYFCLHKKGAAGSPRTQNGATFFGDILTSSSIKGAKYLQMKDDISVEVDESVISTQNLESSSFYEFRKILSSEQYSIGKKVSDFVKDFAASYKSISESAELLPQPVRFYRLFCK